MDDISGREREWGGRAEINRERVVNREKESVCVEIIQIQIERERKGE